MGNTDTIKGVSDEEFIAELKRRASESDALKQKALEALAEGETRPDVKQALEVSEKTAPVEGTELADSKEAEKRKLSPEQQGKLLSILETRLTRESAYKRPNGVEFSEVKTALEMRPDLMWSLAQMENTGGEVNIRAIEGNEFVFCDFSLKPSEDRYNMTYFQVEEVAKAMGADIQSKEGWHVMRECTSLQPFERMWVKSDDIIDHGNAWVLRNGIKGVKVDQDFARYNHPLTGWRAELRVPRV